MSTITPTLQSQYKYFSEGYIDYTLKESHYHLPTCFFTLLNISSCAVIIFINEICKLFK